MVQIQFQLFKKQFYAFELCGYFGFVLAVITAIILSLCLSLSPWIISGLALVSWTAFFIQSILSKVITGDHNLVYYRHIIMIIISSVIFLNLLNQPVLIYLDIQILALGIFLIFGRIGCFMVGCCHGKPYHFGICYGKEHAQHGFNPYFTDTRLFPIQLIESLTVLFIVCAGIMLLFSQHLAGEIFIWYLVNYSLARFLFEFLRGDQERLYIWLFSEAQWFSILIMIMIVYSGLVGLLPFFSLWHFIATFIVIIITLIKIITTYILKKIDFV